MLDLLVIKEGQIDSNKHFTFMYIISAGPNFPFDQVLSHHC